MKVPVVVKTPAFVMEAADVKVVDGGMDTNDSVSG